MPPTLKKEKRKKKTLNKPVLNYLPKCTYFTNKSVLNKLFLRTASKVKKYNPKVLAKILAFHWDPETIICVVYFDQRTFSNICNSKLFVLSDILLNSKRFLKGATGLETLIKNVEC